MFISTTQTHPNAATGDLLLKYLFGGGYLPGNCLSGKLLSGAAEKSVSVDKQIYYGK